MIAYYTPKSLKLKNTIRPAHGAWACWPNPDEMQNQKWKANANWSVLKVNSTLKYLRDSTLSITR